ncbi:MAG TPA: hypothetical protein DEQ02_07525 [Ruminococcaceae bacterium]|nr:hypothetical protein [Oscillospiraceae bacterium]
MRKIFEGEVVTILPAKSGIIAVVVKERVGEQYVIAYQRYSFDTMQTEPVTRTAYLAGKFGENFEICARQLKDHLTCFTVKLPENRILVVYPTGSAGILESDGTVSWHGDILYQDHGPSDGILVEDKIWFSFFQGNAVACYDIETMRYELRIGGGGETSDFVSPEGLWLSDVGTLISCNTVAHKIREIRLDTYEVDEFLGFEEPVYQYIKLSSIEVVRLQSGVYRL